MKSSIRLKVRNMLNTKNNRKIAAGVLIKCRETNKVLLLLRNDKAYEPNTWSMVSGGIESGEEVLEGLKREVKEEISIDPNIIEYEFVGITYSKSKNLDFHYYKGFTNTEFIPKLDYENLDWGWFDKDNLPENLYPNLEGKIDKI
jgi:8-oxo-dGTP pyrophosphatase MutT (NUDIX family)